MRFDFFIVKKINYSFKWIFFLLFSNISFFNARMFELVSYFLFSLFFPLHFLFLDRSTNTLCLEILVPGRHYFHSRFFYFRLNLIILIFVPLLILIPLSLSDIPLLISFSISAISKVPSHFCFSFFILVRGSSPSLSSFPPFFF